MNLLEPLDQCKVGRRCNAEWLRRLVLVVSMVGTSCVGITKGLSADEQSVRLSVEGVSPCNRYSVVTVPIDWTKILAERKVGGVADPNTLRLLDKSETPPQTVPVQWVPEALARAKRSVHTEGDAAETATAAIRGTVVFAVQGNTAKHDYRLVVRVRKDGTFIQVPYPPADWHWIAKDGSTSSPTFPTMQIHPQWPAEGVVDLFQDSKRVLGYHIGPTTAPAAGASPRRPYIFPVVGPDGVALTEFGKPHDPTGSHAHHYSLWIAHNSVNGHDFWSEKGGAIVHAGFAEQMDGPVFCRTVQSTRWVWDNTDLVHERRTVTLYHTPPNYRLIDFDLQFSTAGNEPVTFGQTTFGFLAMRVRQSMSVFDGGGEIVNSNGSRNEANVHTKLADWIDLSGPIAAGKNPGDGDQWNGIAILDHPTNLNHPTMFHCRNDGWACASFSGKAPYVLEPGKPLNLRYRVVLHQGNSRDGAISSHYDDFARSSSLKVRAEPD